MSARPDEPSDRVPVHGGVPVKSIFWVVVDHLEGAANEGLFDGLTPGFETLLLNDVDHPPGGGVVDFHFHTGAFWPTFHRRLEAVVKQSLLKEISSSSATRIPSDLY